VDTGVDHAAVGWEQVRRLTFVPFLADGRCALVPAGDRLVLPSGEVPAGEDPMLDAGLRVPLVTAGFRRQGFHPFAVEGDHVYVWCEGDDGYRGARPHAEVELWKGPPWWRRPTAPAGPFPRRPSTEARTGQMVRHRLERLVAPGGRLLVSSYVPGRDRSRHAAAVLRRLGFRVDGVTHPAQVPGRPHPPTAWIQLP
jgi:hypothetical protein